MVGQAIVIRGDALHIPLRDETVDLVVTSPGYFALRDYQTAHKNEVGSEATPAAYLESLWAVTRELKRVLKPGGVIWINLGDKFGRRGADKRQSFMPERERGAPRYTNTDGDSQQKSLIGLPWRYAIGCIDQLGLILRRDLIWHKPSALPESVTDRPRSSHEYWFMLTKQPRYYSAIDELREDYLPRPKGGARGDSNGHNHRRGTADGMENMDWLGKWEPNPLGKLPGSVWSIPSEPLRLPPWIDTQHYACVDSETEILTRCGWLRHDQLELGQEVAGYNLDTGTAEWTRLHGLFAYHHDGEMVAVDKRDLSMRLTTNHRTIVHKRRWQDAQIGSMEVITADQLGPQHFIPRSAEWAPDTQAKTIGPDLAALCGWVAAEGWYHGYGVYLSQSLTANPEKVAAIDALLSRLHYTPVAQGERWRRLLEIRRTERHRTWKGRPWIEVQWRLPLGVGQFIRRLMPEKLLTAELANLTEGDARALLDAFIDADGHRRPDGRIGIYQKDRRNLDWLQMIAVRLGYKTTLRCGADKWYLHLTKGGRPITLRSTNGVHAPIPREHYQGIVWCPQTGTGTFIARRNGSVFITGNSFPTEWPRRLILGFTPNGICTVCGTERVPVVDRTPMVWRQSPTIEGRTQPNGHLRPASGTMLEPATATILGYACQCTPHTNHPGTGEPSGEDSRYGDAIMNGKRPQNFDSSWGPTETRGLSNRPKVGPWREYHLAGWTPPPTRPAIVLDCFGGTGTTAAVAKALGRIGISIDLSEPYSRLATDRTLQAQRAAKVLGRRNQELQGVLAW